MMRTILVIAALCGLGACESGTGSGAAWYEQGDANYDALKAAHDACAAKSGTYQVKPGGDPTHLGDYQCVGVKDK
jgi:hypothetical protein